ncbi:MAG: hypothetical protein V1726_05035 [Methanobacteriota archaeon]
MKQMDVFGYIIPFWAVLIGILVIALVLWKVLKFAVWIFIIIVIAIIALIGLDFLVGIFHSIGL